jgi:hypothetical protein
VASLRTISGPVIKADRLVSLSVLYADGHHVDFDRTVTWRDEPAYLTAFFDYLEYGMPIGICRVANALISMHTFMDMYTACVTSGRSGVIGAVPNTDPLNWAIDRFLPPLPLQLNPSTQAWNPHSGDIAEMSMNGRHASDGS